MSSQDGDVAQLIDMGFTQDQARQALTESNGNLEFAINYLLMGGGGGTSSSSEPPRQAGTTTTSTSTTNRLIQGRESQYSVPDGRSACTCMALTAASHLLSSLMKEDDNVQQVLTTNDFLDNILIQQGVQNYHSLSSSIRSSSSVEHLSAEEVLQNPSSNVMFDSMENKDGSIRQGILSHDPTHPMGLRALLQGIQQEQDNNEWMCIVMTKTPETVLLVFPPPSKESQQNDFFWLVDSHPRPQLGVEQAYAKGHNSLEELVLTLQEIFLPTELGPDIPEMMAMMYNSFDLYPLTTKKKKKT